MSKRLTSAQRRQIKKLAPYVDEVTDGDRVFFEQHPGRQHRIRLSHLCEIAQNEIITQEAWTISADMVWLTAVKSIVPGIRSRLYTVHDKPPPGEVSEKIAREIYEALKTPQAQGFETAVRQLKAAGV